MNQYPNFSLTLLLAFTLLPPFALTKLNLQPYPAIILPSGARKVDVGAREISFNRISLWGKHEKKDIWTRVDVETFLAPIPVHYLPAIARNSFGLNSAKGKIINLPKGVNILSKKVTPSEVQRVKHWLRQKLVQSGYASDELMITFERVNFDIETGKILTSNRSHEEILRLD